MNKHITSTHLPIPDLSIRETDKSIVVVGLPASGKSFLATHGILPQLLTKGVRDIKIFRTDDYIKHGFEKSLYILMDDFQERRANVVKKEHAIIEGVQGYRLLRKGLELGTFSPDLVITCEATTPIRKQRIFEREGKKLNEGFDSALMKIWTNYQVMLRQQSLSFKIPRFIAYNSITNQVT